METRASYLLVGAFSLIVVVGALLFVLWSANHQGEITEYEINFTRGVSGLSVGNDVVFNGVRVGQVSDILISPKDPSSVMVRIKVASDTPVRRNSEASLEVRGITGLSVVNISGGTVDSPLVPKLPDDQVYMIPSKLSGIQTIIASAPDVLTALNTLVERANSALSQENIQSLTAILDSAAKIAETMADNRKTITDAAKAIEQAGEIFAEVGNSVDSLAKTTRKVISEDFRQAAAGVNQMASMVNRVVSEAEPGLKRLSREGTDELQRLLTEAGNLMRQIRHLVLQIERDPRRFLLGDPVPEYTLP